MSAAEDSGLSAMETPQCECQVRFRPPPMNVGRDRPTESIEGRTFESAPTRTPLEPVLRASRAESPICKPDTRWKQRTNSMSLGTDVARRSRYFATTPTYRRFVDLYYWRARVAEPDNPASAIENYRLFLHA